MGAMVAKLYGVLRPDPYTSKQLKSTKQQFKIHSAKVCHPTPPKSPPPVKAPPPLLSGVGWEAPPPPCHMKLAPPLRMQHRLS